MPSAMARQVGSDGSALIGYLVWFSVPEIVADYDELKDLAAQVGLHEDYTPAPPTARDAWRKATRTGRRGLRVPSSQLNQARVDEARARGQGTPRVYIRTVEISRGAPELVRHLVLFAVRPNANGADEQLELGTVAVLKFDTQSEVANVSVDAGGQDWVRTSYVHQVALDMENDMRDYIGNSDNNKVRASIRDMLVDFHRLTLKNTGGVYFVPVLATHAHANGSVTTASQGLDAMSRWVGSMEKYATGEPPMFRRVYLEGENARELRGDIQKDAISKFRRDLMAVSESLEPVIEDRAVGRTAERIIENAVAGLGGIMEAARSYRESLDMDLSELEAMFRMAKSTIESARGQGLDQDQDLEFDDIMDLLV